MTEIAKYWFDDRAAPYSTLLRIVDTYCHPEVRHDNYESLIRRAQNPSADDAEIRTFKDELTRLLEGDLAHLHPQALTTATWYDEDSDEEFLQKLWQDLYPDEPVPSPEASG